MEGLHRAWPPWQLRPIFPHQVLWREGALACPAQGAVFSALMLPDQAAPARQALGFVLSPSSDTPQRERFTLADPGRFSLADDFVGPPFANTLKGTNPHPDRVMCVCSEPCLGSLRSRAGAGTGHWDSRRGAVLPGALIQAVL